MKTENKHYLKTLGWKDFFDHQIENPEKDYHRIARITHEHKDHYVLMNNNGEKIIGLISGKWKKNLQEQDYPSVGDWVLTETNPTSTQIKYPSFVIEKRLIPYSQIIRRAAGTQKKAQVLASNIDIAFIVSSCNQEMDLKRIDRYIALLDTEIIKPILILNKCDLEVSFQNNHEALQKNFPQIPLILTRSDQPESLFPIQQLLTQGITSVFLGSSGVGKSTLTNLLLGDSKQLVQPIRNDDSKGRHTTTSRTLFLLPTPLGIIIDTPGLREIQLTENFHLDGPAFSDISQLALACRFSDCKHQTEPDCAVKLAVQKGEVSAQKLSHFQKLLKENQKNYHSSSQRKK